VTHREVNIVKLTNTQCGILEAWGSLSCTLLF